MFLATIIFYFPQWISSAVSFARRWRTTNRRDFRHVSFDRQVGLQTLKPNQTIHRINTVRLLFKLSAPCQMNRILRVKLLK